MFDIGFSEMLLVAVIALIVLGPERLPRVAKQAGQWLGKLQRYVNDVKSDINRQMELEELRKLQTEVSDAARSIESSVAGVVSQAQTEFDAVSTGVSSQTQPAPTETASDWDRIYAARRTREKLRERRRELEKQRGEKPRVARRRP